MSVVTDVEALLEAEVGEAVHIRTPSKNTTAEIIAIDEWAESGRTIHLRGCHGARYRIATSAHQIDAPRIRRREADHWDSADRLVHLEPTAEADTHCGGVKQGSLQDKLLAADPDELLEAAR
jgi:hypothetical protein